MDDLITQSLHPSRPRAEVKSAAHPLTLSSPATFKLSFAGALDESGMATRSGTEEQRAEAATNLHPAPAPAPSTWTQLSRDNYL